MNPNYSKQIEDITIEFYINSYYHRPDQNPFIVQDAFSEWIKISSDWYRLNSNQYRKLRYDIDNEFTKEKLFSFIKENNLISEK